MNHTRLFIQVMVHFGPHKMYGMLQTHICVLLYSSLFKMGTRFRLFVTYITNCIFFQINVLFHIGGMTNANVEVELKKGHMLHNL
jgi:hypothetical protein